jgi:hypothetical protein
MAKEILGAAATTRRNTAETPVQGNQPSITQQAVDLEQQKYNDAAPAMAAQREADTLATVGSALDKGPMKRKKAASIFRKMVAKSMGMSDTPSRGPDLLTPRIAGGRLNVSTPNMAKAGLTSPGQMSTVADRAGNVAMQNRNATKLRQSPAVQAALAKVRAEDLDRKAVAIAGKVNAANPQTRANQLATMPGVNGVVLKDAGGKLYAGGAGQNPADVAGAAVASVNAAATPKFQAPAVPSTIPAAPAVASSVPSFTPPPVGTVAVSKPATPSVPGNPGADFMDTAVAKATQPAPAAQPVIARGTTSPIFSPRMPGATPRALTPRQPQVRQMAVTKPQNPLFARS